MSEPNEAIERAVQILGSAARLAAVLEVSPQAVSFWRDGTRRILADKCPLIERATKGEVRCEDLRPDVAWDVLRAQVVTPPVADRAVACHVQRTLRAISRPADHPGYRDNTERPRAGGGR